MAKSGTVPFYNGAISQSARFGGNNYLTNELDAPSDNQNFTISTWFKRSKLGAEEGLWAVDATGSYCRFETSGAIRVRQYNGIINAITDGFFRDPSAWYHLVVAWDMDNSTEADRIIIYVNSVRQTLGTYHAPTTSETSNINADGRTLHIGSSYSSGATQYFEGYMADFNFVDGSVLAPTSFGETKNGIWIPITPTGLTYGNNGFRLQFDQVGVGTASASTIGADTSGNTNHWTSSGIVASDCAMPDSPENNFATMNSLLFRVANGTQVYSEGNLKYGQPTANSWGFGFTTLNVKSGKWYAEIRCAGNVSVTAGVNNVGHYGYQHFLGQNPQDATGQWILYHENATTKSRFNGSLASATYSAFNNSQILGIALNADDKELSFYVDGTLQSSLGSSGVVDISTGGSADDEWSFFANTFYGSSETMTWNFGQDSSFLGTETATSNADGNGIGTFHTAPPSGYLALCTANLPEPTIGPNSTSQADDHFNTVLYTGNANARSITGVGFQPDWVWIKTRGAGLYHFLTDSSRGVTHTLSSNTKDNETFASEDVLSAFGSDGFSLTADDGSGYYGWNRNNDTLVAWNWKADGGTTTTNDASSTGIGTIDSVFQANTTAGFSIVTYTGNSTAGATVRHGLTVAPEMVIVKVRGGENNWVVYHKGQGVDKYIELNLSTASQAQGSYNMFNSTAPTSSVFTIGSLVNTNTSNNYIAYCFHPVEGYSRFGKYIGSGNADGTFVFTGFRPRYIMTKLALDQVNAASWQIYDTARNPNNVIPTYLFADSNIAESDTGSTYYNFDILSNGFKLRAGNTYGVNQAGATYIYMAFAEAPFKYANAK